MKKGLYLSMLTQESTVHRHADKGVNMAQEFRVNLLARLFAYGFVATVSSIPPVYMDRSQKCRTIRKLIKAGYVEKRGRYWFPGPKLKPLVEWVRAKRKAQAEVLGLE